MNFYLRRFNLYLLLTALVVLVGCATGKKEDKPVATLRVHIECAANVAGSGQSISVLRSEPVLVSITSTPILSEGSIIEATLIDAPGGGAVKVKFDEAGSTTLEQFTAANPGKHLVIGGSWGEKPLIVRWLAAPIITHRIADGTLAFTPDATAEEAAALVQGLNNVAKKNLKNQSK
jgi:preprotein translocase subunit SecD